MSSSDQGTLKTAAVCTACGEMYVSRVTPDGSVQPIGVDGCTCGEGELRPMQ